MSVEEAGDVQLVQVELTYAMPHGSAVVFYNRVLLKLLLISLLTSARYEQK